MDTLDQVTWQPSLLTGANSADPNSAAAGHPPLDEPDFAPTLLAAQRRDLGRGAWVDHISGWSSGADTLFELIYRTAPWHAEGQRVMYDRKVEVPRLTTGGWHVGRPKVLERMARSLSRRYGTELVSISANLYRDGRDSVAWHGDRVGNHRVTTIVAILSLGSPRRLLLRPEGGGASIGYTLHSGDLLVQGGTCQRTHQHCVPKRANAGPRISIMFRERFGN